MIGHSLNSSRKTLQELWNNLPKRPSSHHWTKVTSKHPRSQLPVNWASHNTFFNDHSESQPVKFTLFSKKTNGQETAKYQRLTLIRMVAQQNGAIGDKPLLWTDFRAPNPEAESALSVPLPREHSPVGEVPPPREEKEQFHRFVRLQVWSVL
jgi:hypothetical protein